MNISCNYGDNIFVNLNWRCYLCQKKIITKIEIIIVKKAIIKKITTEPKNALVKQYKKLLEIDGVELEFEPDALEAIVDKAIERKTGARGLRSIIENVMTDIMYDIPSNEKIEKCIITKDTIQNNAKPKIIENPNKESKKKQRVQAEVKETA